MSDSSVIAELTAQASQLQYLNSVIVSGAALVFYDYALTLSTEISEIWNSKLSGAQALFFLSRYGFMVYTVVYCTDSLTPNPSETLCRVMSFSARTAIIVSEIGLYGILTLRTYAIYQRNPLILMTVALSAGTLVTLAVYLEIIAKPVVGSSVFGTICGVEPSTHFPRIQLIGQICALILDVLVFGFTFAKTIHHTIEMKKVGLGNGLGYFILRDGFVYFLAKLLFGVVGTTIFFVPVSGAIADWLGVVASITNPLNFILVNRLVLNLRRVSHLQEGNVPTLGVIRTIQEPAFAVNSLLGNLGAPLRVGQDDDDEIDEIGIDDDAEVAEERRVVDHGEIIEEIRDSEP